MTACVYSFSASSIQTYILASSRLKDRIGASEQIASLCDIGCDNNLLDRVLKSLRLSKKLQFPRRAGGAFIAVFPANMENQFQEAERLQALWTFTVQQELPSLRFAQGIGTADNIPEAVLAALNKQRVNKQQYYPELPLAPPLAEYAPRSGRAAFFREPTGDKELLDLSTQRKREKSDGERLIQKLGELGMEKLEWPTLLPDKDNKPGDSNVFPVNDDNTIAVLHADINNLGNISQDLAKRLEDTSYISDMKKFTEGVEESVMSAVNEATRFIAKQATNNYQTMPARPLVLAGDDITFILRTDIALPFTEILLKALEQASTRNPKLKQLRKRYSNKQYQFPKYLTACAGIVYIKSSQPLYQAYKLADSLCDTAKKASKKRKKDQKLPITPSSLAFHRITTSMIEQYGTVLEKELTTDSGLVLSMQPYFVNRTQNTIQHPSFTELVNIQLLLDQVGSSRVRPLLSMLYESETKADEAFIRWCDVLDKTGYKEIREEFMQKLSQLTGKDNKKESKLSDFYIYEKTHKKTPLADAITLTRVNASNQEYRSK